MSHFPMPAAKPASTNFSAKPEPYPILTNFQMCPPQPGKEELISPLAYTSAHAFPSTTLGTAFLQPSFQYSAVPNVPGLNSPPSVPRSSIDVHCSSDRGIYKRGFGSERGSLSGSEAGSPRKSITISHIGKASKYRQKQSPVLVCDQCGKTFSKPYNLKSHYRSHSSDRPYKCLHCPKAFARSHDKTRHEQLHGGVKNFKCEGYLKDGVTRWGCGKSFARSDALSRHFRTETGWLCVRAFMDEAKSHEVRDEKKFAEQLETECSQTPMFTRSVPIYYAPLQPLQQIPFQMPYQQVNMQPPQQIPHTVMSYGYPGERQHPVLLPPLLRH